MAHGAPPEGHTRRSLLTFHCSAYGLRVRSNRTLKGLVPRPATTPGQVDVDLTFAGDGSVEPEWQGLSWHPAREMQGENWSLAFLAAPGGDGVRHRLRTRLGQDETNVYFSPDGARVSLHWSHETPDDEARLSDLSAWALDAALGFSARLRGWTVLHAASVVIEGKAVGLVGDKGAGKSTLAAAFLAEGFQALADDHTVLREEDGAFVVQPGPPVLKLWPSSAPVLAKEVSGLPRAYSFLEKLRVDLGAGADGEPGRFHDGPAPLRALYVLGPRDRARTGVTVESLTDAAALHQLMVYRWSRHTVTPEHAAAELGAMARLVRTAPVLRVHRPDGIGTLPQVVRAICSDLDERPG